MAHIFDTNFIEISVFVLKKIQGKLQFDIYLKRAKDKYTKLFQKGDTISSDRLERYWKGKNIEKLSVSKDEYRQYLFYVERVADKYFQEGIDVSAEEIRELTQEILDLTMLELFVDYKVDQVTITHASQSVKGCIDIMRSNPKSLVKIFKHINQHPYLMKHSIATGMFSIMLAKKDGNESSKTFEKLGLGAFLHDIGMGMISFDCEDKDSLTPEEWKEIKEHPQLGKRILDGVKSIPTEVKQIVLQHHEQPNGVGYPNQLHDKDIIYLSKIVSIADSFSALTSKRPYQNKMDPTEALESMRIDEGKFDKRLLQLFKELFNLEN